MASALRQESVPGGWRAWWQWDKRARGIPGFRFSGEQLKVEQQQEQQGGVQVEQQVGEGASIAQHEAELQVERRGCRW